MLLTLNYFVPQILLQKINFLGQVDRNLEKCKTKQ